MKNSIETRFFQLLQPPQVAINYKVDFVKEKKYPHFCVKQL